MNPGLNRDQLIELKELLADRMVDDMSTGDLVDCLLYTSPSPRDGSISRMPSSA